MDFWIRSYDGLLHLFASFHPAWEINLFHFSGTLKYFWNYDNEPILFFASDHTNTNMTCSVNWQAWFLSPPPTHQSCQKFYKARNTGDNERIFSFDCWHISLHKVYMDMADNCYSSRKWMIYGLKQKINSFSSYRKYIWNLLIYFGFYMA